MSDRGKMLPGNSTGQVVIRGPSVTLGYDGDPAAIDAAFTSGWFKTGDLVFSMTTAICFWSAAAAR